MRVLVVDSYYSAFLADHYAHRPELREASYEAQHAALMQRRFGTSDAYSRAFSRLGIAAVEVVANDMPLQARWAAEHGVARGLRSVPGGGPARPFLRRTLRQRILDAQIEAFDPDVVYAQDPHVIGPSLRRKLRNARRLLVLQIASGPVAPRTLTAFDLVVTSFPHWVPRLREAGVDAEYLTLAFDPEVLTCFDGQGEAVGASFVGSLHLPRSHTEGSRLLEQVCTAAEVEVWGPGADKLPPDSPVLRRYHGEAWGVDMYRVLARSAMTVNRHSDLAEGLANNMRLYEATGVGTLLLTESAPNLVELFEPGREVITYEDADDLVGKLRHYAAKEDERREIALAGQRRTLESHTYRQRIAELVPMLERRLR